MEYTHKVKFENRKGKVETVPAYSLRQARAIGLSWSKTGSFKIYTGNELETVYINGHEYSLREE